MLKSIKTIPGISDHDRIIMADFYLSAQINKRSIPHPHRIPLWSWANCEAMQAAARDFSDKFLDEIAHYNMEQSWENLSLTSRTSWRSTSLQSLWPATSTSLGCRHHWRRWLKRGVACTRRPRRRDGDGTITLSSSVPPSKPLNRHTGSMSTESSPQAAKKVTVNPSGDTSRAYIKTARAFLYWSPVHISSQTSTKTPSSWATSSALSSLMTTPLKWTTCYTVHSTPQSDPWKCQNLESISSCRTWKATGPDNIPVRILKELAEDLSMAITALLNKSLDAGVLPSTWKDAWATPIFKKGTCNDHANYRPVSLTSIICKVAEHVISSHVRDHLDKHQILSGANHGFRHGHSCQTQLLLRKHDLLMHQNLRHQVDVGILDFSKAFDTVPYRHLISKLRLYGIDGRILHWIQAFLSGLRQLVLCDVVKSQYSPVTSGFTQGTVRGPLLFLLHINDIPSSVDPHMSVCLFVDDALVYRVIHTIQDQVILQQDFTRLEGWAKPGVWCLTPPNVTQCTSTAGTPSSRISTR